ncbi:MAG: hypothetical protein CO103_08170 [Chloroflexi bacterium CG_4_9_14_3_um_filter_45_9]|nr:MAG: hypothetical protein AUK00_00765 [Dehalococcoidia bacterium CG2_30_46_9]PIU23714.1 MAG: hypothetical protein COT13_01580 [Chloroflexi bacterium CG08_land_8_20_14_0_20_45_12]PIX26861.1 MAG: hypothetical protein COZ67_05350 [Chloroflexi bacterium CG_4_8_14_3_um_filter_45_15]PJB47712.1 MAG: hypothetical protein CO103_08170 [Chloroflexi bacterium CG_4_9_14_3_um_filter_45_9]
MLKLKKREQLQWNMVIRTRYHFLLVCLALSLVAGYTASCTAPSAANGGTLSTYQLEINLLGTKNRLLVDSQGRPKTNVEISSADDRISLSFNKGTVGLDKDQRPLQAIDAAIDPSPPPSPKDAYIVGAVYDFKPEGANFKPQIKLTLSYDQRELLEGLREENVYIACYQDTGWGKLLNKKVDTESHKVTSEIDHFARFAVLAPRVHPTSGMPLVPSDKVEVVYFHRTQRCSSCLYAEKWTRYTVETYFADELASGKVVFKVLNVEDKENAAIVKKYGAFTSSLFINTIKDGTDHIKEATDVYTLIGKDDAFVKAVKSNIEKSLKGEA